MPYWALEQNCLSGMAEPAPEYAIVEVEGYAAKLALGQQVLPL